MTIVTYLCEDRCYRFVTVLSGFPTILTLSVLQHAPSSHVSANNVKINLSENMQMNN